MTLPKVANDPVTTLLHFRRCILLCVFMLGSAVWAPSARSQVVICPDLQLKGSPEIQGIFDIGGKVWIGTTGGAFEIVQDEARRRSSDDTMIIAKVMDTVLLGGNGKLLSWDGTSPRPVAFFDGHEVEAILPRDQRPHAWVGTNQGLFYLNIETGQVIPIPEARGRLVSVLHRWTHQAGEGDPLQESLLFTAADAIWEVRGMRGADWSIDQLEFQELWNSRGDMWKIERLAPDGEQIWFTGKPVGSSNETPLWRLQEGGNAAREETGPGQALTVVPSLIEGGGNKVWFGGPSDFEVRSGEEAPTSFASNIVANVIQGFGEELWVGTNQGVRRAFLNTDPTMTSGREAHLRLIPETNEFFESIPFHRSDHLYGSDHRGRNLPVYGIVKVDQHVWFHGDHRLCRYEPNLRLRADVTAKKRLYPNDMKLEVTNLGYENWRDENQGRSTHGEGASKDDDDGISGSPAGDASDEQTGPEPWVPIADLGLPKFSVWEPIGSTDRGSRGGSSGRWTEVRGNSLRETIPKSAYVTVAIRDDFGNYREVSIESKRDLGNLLLCFFAFLVVVLSIFFVFYWLRTGGSGPNAGQQGRLAIFFRRKNGEGENQ